MAQVSQEINKEKLRLVYEHLSRHNEKVYAWQVVEEYEKLTGTKLNEVSVRATFITMGVPLASIGTPTTKKKSEQEQPKVEELSERSTFAQTLQVQKFQVSDDLKDYIPKAEQFACYVERPIDEQLAAHYNTRKYPITQGKQGTGKTFSHEYYAYKNNLPFFLFSCYEDFKLAKLFGDKTIVNGSIQFRESLFVKAIQSPSVVLFDEVNAVSNANTYDFHALLQNRELFIKDAEDGKGKIYKLHHECRIGFAQNPRSAKYIGSNIKQSNFLGRCTFLTYPDFTTSELTDAVRGRFNGKKIDAKDISKFVIFYQEVVMILEQNNISIDVSIRQLMSTMDLWMAGLDLPDALHGGIMGFCDAVSLPKVKDALNALAQGVWEELMKK